MAQGPANTFLSANSRAIRDHLRQEALDHLIERRIWGIFTNPEPAAVSYFAMVMAEEIVKENL